ncbi:hypothetical protein SAY87_022623 [Trapa incisa]|uniref:WRKY domain-containing protein n=1 Tax=Trapa incisa TaxID=236973 RepID=A0AAN7K4M3_9MYRT|nr:hypothetical protein SAY87_022623 [Trapa incisa]
MPSPSQVALQNNYHSLFASDHHQEDQQAAPICSNMAFSNFTSATTTFPSSSSSLTFQSAHNRNITSGPTSLSLPNTDLSPSSPLFVAAETLISCSSCATAAPFNESNINLTGPTHMLSLHPERTFSASANNFWAWSELNQRPLSNDKLIRSDNIGTIVRDSDHSHQQPPILNSNNKLLGVSAMKVKRIKGRRKVREPRFCFKTLSDVDVLDDGYKWRKYGQKVVKNTQYPRSYYRCTQDNCRVKKRVERLDEDPRMVITTYEGRHAHSPSRDTDQSRAATNPHLNDYFW